MSREKNNKRSKGRFVGIPFSVLESEQGKSLTPYEVKLLVDLLLQYTGSNNGHLSPCFELMKQRDWAKGTLYRTKNSLIKKGFIVVTRQGKKQRGSPTLVAITWNGIDKPKDNVIYDDGIKVDASPLRLWLKPN